WDTGAKDEFGAFHAPPNGVLAHGIQPEIFWRVEIQCTVGRHLGEPALDGVAVGNHPTAGFYPVIKLWLLGCQQALIAAARHQYPRVMGQLGGTRSYTSLVRTWSSVVSTGRWVSARMRTVIRAPKVCRAPPRSGGPNQSRPWRCE